VEFKLAEELENWLTSDTAKSLINGYEISGQALFKFNAKQE
jgi:tungstate transport system substrate-binding protein